jgi:hypothetical protein
MQRETIWNIGYGILLFAFILLAAWVSAIFNREWLFGYFMIPFIFMSILLIKKIIIKPEEALTDAELKEILEHNVQRFDDYMLPSNIPAQVVDEDNVEDDDIPDRPIGKDRRKHKGKR